MKYILILAILFYVFYKVTSFFFKAGEASAQNRQRQATEGKKPKANGGIKGGDYVDYEEIK